VISVDWTGFITGVISAAFAFALFSSNHDDKDDLEAEVVEEGIKINGTAGRHVTMSCQTCRKLKKHKEVEPDLYQCTRCKRHVDLRRVS
jgi:uncharacterized paraquat-inducible protein A